MLPISRVLQRKKQQKKKKEKPKQQKKSTRRSERSPRQPKPPHKRPKRTPYNQEALLLAARDFKEGMTARQASECYGIPATTIQDKAAEKYKTNRVGRPTRLASKSKL
jgi:hypothetical protein